MKSCSILNIDAAAALATLQRAGRGLLERGLSWYTKK